MRAKRGIAYIVIQAILALFIVAVLYVLFGYIYEFTRNQAEEALTELNLTNTRSQETLNILDVVWKVFPLFIIFGVIIWVIVQSQKKEYAWEGV